MAHSPLLMIADAKVVQALYTQQNASFGKHPLVKNLTYALTGHSILFAETTDDWRKRRTSLSPAFYKGKLIAMIGLAKVAIQGTLDRWLDKAKEGTAQIDLINEVSLLGTRILLQCAINETLDNEQMDYYEGGKIVKKDISFALRQIFNDLI